MKKTTLKLREILQLEAEIGGVTEGQEVKLKGLLRQPISQLAKFNLTKLLKEISSITGSFNTVKDNLIKEKGTPQEDGSYKIEDVEGFSKEMLEVLDQEHEISHYDFKIEQLETETDEFYPVMYSIIDIPCMS